MLVDALFDRFVTRFRKFKRQEYLGSQLDENGQPESKPKGHGLGMFNGAKNFVMKNPTLISIDRPQIIQIFAAGKPGFCTIHGPRCRYGFQRPIPAPVVPSWDTFEDRGPPVHTGKSAVAQTFAEWCDECGRLGASFFFSRQNDRNNPQTVIPSLVYQLAVYLPDYKSLVTSQLANDPELLRKTRRTQFKKLIVEPFLFLQLQRHKSVQEPLLVILDGLDECDGESAQREIVEMISEPVLLDRGFPLVWLICSRPEAHLKYLFSRADFTVNCGREDLIIDAESIADVDLYLRDGLAGVKDHFPDVTAPAWPSTEQFNDISRKASGHFAFASTALLYIGDPIHATPMARLDDLLFFLKGVRIGPSNPLEGLDALYTRIFLDVPTEVLPTIKRLLGLFLNFPFQPTLAVCNIFYIDQVTFYHTFRKLHSVIDVPFPEAALDTPLRFHHASFEDYLLDPRRSGRFSIARENSIIDFAKLSLSWYKADLALFHMTDRSAFNTSHLHGILPGLTWVLDNNEAYISYAVAMTAERVCWWACSRPEKWDEPLLSQVQLFDFKYIHKGCLDHDWHLFVNKLWKMDSSSGIIRTEPRSEVDLQLLEHMRSMVEPALSCRPASFPLLWLTDGGDYFLLGHHSEAIVCWTTGPSRDVAFGVLNCDDVPSEERINTYQAWLLEKT